MDLLYKEYKMAKWTDEMINVLHNLYEDHTYEEIADYINTVFDTSVTENAVRKAYERYKLPIIKVADRYDAPKILILDIETAPILGKVWGLWKNNVALNQIENDWYILSWAAKWYGNDEVMYMDQRKSKNIEDDTKILKKIWKLLDEADIIISQNGKGFDIPKLNARFVIHGMQPPSSFRNIDTLLIAKKHFKFTSNKLEYMTDKLCVKFKKLKHGKFPGMELWNECLKGNKEAWDEMEKYNRYDVLSLEELYEKLIPWDDSINFTIYFDSDVCSCGSENFTKNGLYYTNASRFQKFRCDNCGKEFRGKKNLLTGKKKRVTNRRG